MYEEPAPYPQSVHETQPLTLQGFQGQGKVWKGYSRLQAQVLFKGWDLSVQNAHRPPTPSCNTRDSVDDDIFGADQS